MTILDRTLRPDRQRPKTLRNLQALRAIAALLVLAAHTWQANGFTSDTFGTPVSGMQHRVAGHLGTIGVDLFFVISGLIMVVTTSKVRHGATAARRFLWRRVARIYPPYLIITTLIFGIYLARPELVNPSSPVRPDATASFLLLPQSGRPLLAVGWTLVFEMYFYLVFTLSVLLSRRLAPLVLVGWVGGATLIGQVPTTSVWLATMSSPVIVEFLFGAAIGWLVATDRLYAPKVFAVLGTSAWLIGYAIWITPGNAIDGNLRLRVFTLGVALTALVYGFVGLERTRRWHLPAALAYLGDSSYSLYLTHLGTLKVLSLILLAVGVTQGPVVHLATVVVALVSSVGVAILFYGLIEAPLLRLLQNPRRTFDQALATLGAGRS